MDIHDTYACHYIYLCARMLGDYLHNSVGMVSICLPKTCDVTQARAYGRIRRQSRCQPRRWTICTVISLIIPAKSGKKNSSQCNRIRPFDQAVDFAVKRVSKSFCFTNHALCRRHSLSGSFSLICTPCQWLERNGVRTPLLTSNLLKKLGTNL